jgi:hypothetical protein
MPRRYQTKVWQLQMPDGWNVSDGGGHEFVTFFRPDGVGLLTVLTVEQQPALLRSDTMFGRPLPDAAIEQKSGVSHRRTWTFSCRGHKVYVRYSCAAQNAESERSEVDKIVQSIKESDHHS